MAVITVEGTISPTTTNYIRRGIKEANEMGAQCLIVEIDTPGGLLKSTKNIVQAFLDSDDLPIVAYVSPEGASAASAGTFITMASHIAAMARQAETERDRRAKAISAEGEFQAAAKMVDAAKLMEKAPMALQLRFLQTMTDISEENTTYALLPLPMEMLDVFKGMGAKMKGDPNDGDDRNSDPSIEV